MKYPIIGISAAKVVPATPRHEIQDPALSCPLTYPECVERSGGVPVLLPRTGDEAKLAAAVERIDGLLLSGGGDILSLAYGEEPRPKGLHQDAVRDAMEFAAVKLALKRKLPILGICRGIQSLNVALGGTLVQDIPTQVKDVVQHYATGRDVVLGHTIEISKGSLLAKVLGSTSLAVNSTHHQSVKKLGKGLKVNAKAKDGVIEGVENPAQKILAVQCHPEDCAEEYPVFQKLFDWLVKEAS